MKTTVLEVAPDMQATYPQCISESKSSNLAQAALWSIIAIAFFGIYYQQTDKTTPLSNIQLLLIVTCMVVAVCRLFSSNKLTYKPTGSSVEKHSYHFSTTLKADILQCLDEGNTAHLRALKNDDAGGLMVEFLKSKDGTYSAARLYKYEPHGYIAKTDWVTMK